MAYGRISDKQKEILEYMKQEICKNNLWKINGK